jgi:hypothetical protein
LKSDPDFWVARQLSRVAYVQKGMYNESIAELRTLIKAPAGPIPDKVIEAEIGSILVARFCLRDGGQDG